MTEIVTYLTFDGNCREAMTFYQECLSAELHLMPFSEMPGDYPRAAKDRIMHARLNKGKMALMASDTMPEMPLHQGNNFSISIQCETAHEIDSLFAALGEGGKVTMPLQDQFWGARFGRLTDRFGIQWMLNFTHPKA
jgi:PhnB protein